VDTFLAHNQELDASPTKYHANPFERFATWVLNPIEPSSLSHHILPCPIKSYPIAYGTPMTSMLVTRTYNRDVALLHA